MFMAMLSHDALHRRLIGEGGCVQQHPGYGALSAGAGAVRLCDLDRENEAVPLFGLVSLDCAAMGTRRAISVPACFPSLR